MSPIEPDWPAPSNIRALSTTRKGGVSAGRFASLNLADHVGDDPSNVVSNRKMLQKELGLPADPLWMRQIHGRGVANTDQDVRGCEADAAVAFHPGDVCAVMTADCLPLLLCDRAGTRVAAVHAGWRGLADGVVEAAVARLAIPPGELLCWLGPAIGPDLFEVGAEVRARFLEQGDPDTQGAFRPSSRGKWLADLYALATRRLSDLGVKQVWGGGMCTYSDSDRFFSYRRDGATGRMASLIWIDSAAR